MALAQAYGRVLGKCFLMREVPLYLVRGVLVRARLKQHLDHGLVPVPRRDDKRRVSLLSSRSTRTTALHTPAGTADPG